MRTLEIVHHTRYEYSSPVVLGEHRLMFRPRDSHDLRLLQTSLSIEPAAAVRWIHDPFGNSIAIATFEGETDHLDLTSTIRLEHFAGPVEWPPLETYARTLPFSYATEEVPDLARYVERHYPDPNGAVTGWTKQFLKGEGEAETFATLTRMCKGIQEGLQYLMRFEPGTQPPATTLQTGSGTCRDYALLMMEGSRALGIAARFVTGYLYDPAVDAAAGGAPGTAQPHAWMEVYLPGAGWVEFDPTNGIIGTDRLIRVAVARDPEQAMPLKGSFTGKPGATASTVVDVRVRSIGPDTPRDAKDDPPAASPSPGEKAPPAPPAATG
ncbi:MAG: transglutaminase family protein [Proteobacteria bacterium]|nr:transglutaminase family protein [Pseudomonadota bacterium]